jgi:HAD superfamily hydrolase (TIGR01509 family)
MKEKSLPVKPLKGIKAILWDNDGILVDTEKYYFQSTREFLATLGIDLTHELYLQISLKEGKSALDLALDRGMTADEMLALRQQRDKRYIELLHQDIEIMAGVEEVLKALTPRYKMAVVTSSRRQYFDIIHKNTELLPFFDLILTREDYKNSKPDPEPYQLALEKLEITADEALVVEDSERGVTAAHRADIRCAAIPNPLTHDGDFTLACCVLESCRHLLQLLT